MSSTKPGKDEGQRVSSMFPKEAQSWRIQFKNHDYFLGKNKITLVKEIDKNIFTSISTLTLLGQIFRVKINFAKLEKQKAKGDREHKRAKEEKKN